MASEKGKSTTIEHMWFKDHAYLAAWLSPAVAIVIALLNSKGQLEKIDTFRLLLYILYIAFLTSLAVVFTPSFDEKARNAAEVICFISFGVILVYKRGTE